MEEESRDAGFVFRPLNASSQCKSEGHNAGGKLSLTSENGSWV